ncbi:hypothetical protein BURK2_00757 [Burkholderiales bacterium]|nr:MAG: hypothetical protein F9K47_04220 [Burkholderiales bacterium]CAG0961417.1 hypothetical protein BURK2_00757 [Burkholderiales bacterium]
MLTTKSLCTALAGVSALGVTGAGVAVHVNPQGQGQVLLFPYYTVREAEGGAFNTLLSVVNTTGSAKSVKLRFREGRNARETLDLNVYLSPYDIWTAALVPTAAGAALKTADSSCTTPTQLAAAGREFVNSAYSGLGPTGTPAWDGSPQDLDRGREGYFEIIEMGVITQATVAAWATHTEAYARGELAPAVPLAAAVAFNCAALQAMEAGAGMAQYLVAPTGGLYGGATLVNVAQGIDYTANPVALDAFSDVALWHRPGTGLPNLENVTPKTSTAFASLEGSPVLVHTAWNLSTHLPADPVSAVLMHDTLVNEYVVDGLEAEKAFGTDWVVTFPTKWSYYAPSRGAYWAKGDAEIPVLGLFQRNYFYYGACDDVSIRLWDREERSKLTDGSGQPRPGDFAPNLPWAANVIPFADSDVLASSNTLRHASYFSRYYIGPEGWMRLGLPLVNYSLANSPFNGPAAHRLIGGATLYLTAGATTASTASSATYYGLPAIGFSVNRYTYKEMPTASGTVLANFGGNFMHKGSRTITLSLP